MSVTIHLEDFKSWPEIFEEIERQRNMKLFEIIQPDPSTFQNREKERRALPQMQKERQFEFSVGGKHGHKTTVARRRRRSSSSPCVMISDIQPFRVQLDSRFTDAAKTLSKEKLALLYEDIVKPMDVYSIFKEWKEVRDHK